MIRPLTCLAAALSVSTAAIAQPCHRGPRLFEPTMPLTRRMPGASLPHTAYLTPSTAITSWTRRVPRCRAVGDYDSDDDLWPQPSAEALIKDDMEAEVCRLACQIRAMPLEYAVGLFWRGQIPPGPLRTWPMTVISSSIGGLRRVRIGYQIWGIKLYRCAASASVFLAAGPITGYTAPR